MGEQVIEVMEIREPYRYYEMHDRTAGKLMASIAFQASNREVFADTPWGHFVVEGKGRFSVKLNMTVDKAPFASVYVGPMMLGYTVRFASGPEIALKSWHLGTEYRYEGELGRFTFKFHGKMLGKDQRLIVLTANDNASIRFEHLALAILGSILFMTEIGMD
jgi:hypothetical protein